MLKCGAALTAHILSKITSVHISPALSLTQTSLFPSNRFFAGLSIVIQNRRRCISSSIFQCHVVLVYKVHAQQTRFLCNDFSEDSCNVKGYSEEANVVLTS